MQRSLPLMFVVCLAVLTAPAYAADKVENPEYTRWASFKANSSVTYSSVVSMQGQQRTTTLTITLKEVTDDHVVVNQSIQVEGMPQPMQMDQTHAKMIEPAEIKAFEKEVTNPENKTGEESVEVDGKALDCDVYTVKFEENGKKASGKVWVSTSAPGHMVRMVATQEGVGDVTVELAKIAIAE